MEYQKTKFTEGTLKEGVFTSQSDLNLFEPVLSPIQKFQKRISLCPTLPWGFPSCKDCKTPLTKNPIKLSCLSPFCSCPECVKNRIRVAKFRLNDLNIKSKKLYHFTLGRKDFPISQLVPKERDQTRKAFLEVMKSVSKELKGLHYFGVMDINKPKKEGLEPSVRLHTHIAVLPFKDFRFFNALLQKHTEKVSKKFGFPVAYSGGVYQKSFSIINYFSKRLAGDFGHNRIEEDEKKFGYASLMPLKQYFEVFYKKRNFFTNLKYRSRKGAGLIAMLDNSIPKFCPNCGSSTKLNIFFQTLTDLGIGVDPPPESKFETFNIEAIKVA